VAVRRDDASGILENGRPAGPRVRKATVRLLTAAREIEAAAAQA